ncbi:MAG: pyruvate ferredoxin oxidoreductase [Thermodesulfatator sp.]|nr:MAG: pyruvate ferredoxin oxidoreductase [Thermodesulfatator sp.]
MANSDAIVGWKTITFGCHILEPGNSANFRTGDWRSQRPVTDKEKCIRCGMCWIFCPDMTYKQDEEGYFEADMEYCKGCGICAHECPKDAITMVPEEG